VGLRNGLCILKKRQTSSPARIRTTIPWYSSPLFYSLRHWKAAKWATNKHFIAWGSEQTVHSLVSCRNCQSYTFTAIVCTNGFMLLWWFINYVYRLYRRMLSLQIVTLWILVFICGTLKTPVVLRMKRRSPTRFLMPVKPFSSAPGTFEIVRQSTCQTILKRPGHFRNCATVHCQTSLFGHRFRWTFWAFVVNCDLINNKNSTVIELGTYIVNISALNKILYN